MADYIYPEPPVHDREQEQDRSPRYHSPPPPAQERDPSPDYYYAGGSARGPSDTETRGAPYEGPPRIQYPRRPRSQPPPAAVDPPSKNDVGSPARERGRALVHHSQRHRDRSRSRGSRGNRSRSRSPSIASRARGALSHTFSDSGPAFGYSVLGAIIGGIAARGIADNALPKAKSRSAKEKRDKKRLVSTLVGAAVGGLGANALERRLEGNDEDGSSDEGKEFRPPARHREERRDSREPRRSSGRYDRERNDAEEGSERDDGRRAGHERRSSEQRERDRKGDNIPSDVTDPGDDYPDVEVSRRRRKPKHRRRSDITHNQRQSDYL